MDELNINTTLHDDNDTTRTFVFSQVGCSQGWQERNHAVFQVANACILLGFASPNTMTGNMALHGLLMFGFLLESAWAWVLLCAPDIFSWNFCFMVVNLIQMLYILYQLKPVKFTPELEEVYAKMFEQLRVPRHTFNKLTSSAYSSVNCLHASEAYAVQNVTRTDKLALLISGSASVYNKQQLLHTIGPMEFLDSPEFDAVTTCDDKYQASIIANESCRYILWNRANLSYLLVKETNLAHIMGTLLARDITNKLYALNDKAFSGQGCRRDIRLPAVAEFLSGVHGKHANVTRCSSARTVIDTLSESGSTVRGLSCDLPVSHQTHVEEDEFNDSTSHHCQSSSRDDFTRISRWDSKTNLVSSS